MNMKHTYILALAAFALAACTSDDLTDEALIKQGATCDASAFLAPAFPENDGSTELKSKDKNTNLSKLLKAMDKQRALDRSMFELTDEQWATIKAKADEVCESSKTVSAKITKLNDWVHANVKYDYAANDPWSVFTSKKGVCQGYSNLLKVMLLTQDIPTVGVNGWLNTTLAHAWIYACDGTNWYVCDPTNNTGKTNMTLTSNYSQLQPDMADVIIFEDDNFAFNYQEGYLNVCTVKNADSDLVVPFSTNKFRVASFNPRTAIPNNVSNIYIGSNIKTLGENITGLSEYPAADEYCEVDPGNASLGSHAGVVYNKNSKGELTSLCYIPAAMKTLVLMPMEKVGKNTIYHQLGVEEIVFTEGTTLLESYAIEDCPKLRAVYVPEGCKLEKDAIYNCPKNVEVIYGVPSGIRPVTM